MVLLVFLAFLEEEVVVLDFQALQALQAFLEEVVVLDYFRISYVQDGGELRTTVARPRRRTITFKRF